MKRSLNMLQKPYRASHSQFRPRSQGQRELDHNGNWQAHPGGRPPLNASSLADPKKIRLISWNIDFMAKYPNERMAAALQYLDQLTASTEPDTPIVIFLQEMTSSDLRQICEAAWVRERFKITDTNNQYWRGSNYGPDNYFRHSTYGTTALVDRRLQIQDLFRVPLYTGMDRDGLFVDLALTNTLGEGSRGRWLLRLCNVHLESLAADPPVRPLQMAAAVEYLQDKDDGATQFLHIPDRVACALLAGDLNAIQPFDRTLHVENGLNDAYLELGGQEDSDEGYTWGPQARRWSRERFGCCRMDKILYRGGLRLQSFERIGVGVKVADDVLEEVEKEVEGGFVTDHYGVMGDFELTDDWKLVTWQGNEEQTTDSAPL